MLKMLESRPVRAAKTRAQEAIRTISLKSKRPMKSNPKPKNQKPKIIKKLSVNESELKAGKVNTKLAVKKVLQDISNNTNIITKTKSKIQSSKDNESSQLTVKIQNSSTTIKATPFKPIALQLFKESFMTSSSSSLVSPSFVPADKSTPLQNHTNGTSPSQCSALFFTSDESSSCAAIETSVAPAEDSKSKQKPYSFGMIETDDSTDEEDDVEQRPDKRPPPPAWSLPANRNEAILCQLNIPTKIIDNMFGPAMDVDLQEIFPNICKKLLTRRDSSFVWQTPPRYSVMPKY